MNKITVYTTEPCGYCRQAKALLDKRGLSFEEINLARDADGRAELAARTGMMTFPQVIIGDELVGGFTELVSADRTGRLADLVSAEPLI
jgi:glutaredoxin 3